jgi:small-conductance mechanosensitive channel
MNLKTIIIIIIAFSVFLGFYLINMVGALALLVGVGFGIYLHDFVKDIIDRLQKNIYLTEKVNMEHRKKQIEAELERLNKGD